MLKSIDAFTLGACAVSFALIAGPAATAQVIDASVDQPATPFGTAFLPESGLTFMTNTARDTVAVFDDNALVATIDVGDEPRGIVGSFDERDVLVANAGSDTISIIDVRTLTVRKTLSSPLLDEPFDIALGPVESVFSQAEGEPAVPFAFGSGVAHAFIVNRGNSEVAIYESGPTGVEGLGFDDIIGAVEYGAVVPPIQDAASVVLDTVAPLDTFAKTIGAYVAHTRGGVPMVTRVALTTEQQPGPQVVDTTTEAPNLRGKAFTGVSEFKSTHVGQALDALVVSRAEPDVPGADFDRVLLLSMTGGVIDAFDVDSGVFLKRIEVGSDVPDLVAFLQG